ncbi:MAG: diaminopimelate epimerase, partial [Candidatus Omnitrophica bacterium CG07_land_8_20_14_0_80_50_8]
RIMNPDGSEAPMCGNGVRCLAKFAADRGIARHRLSIETLAGMIYADVKGERVKARMVEPTDLKLNFEIRVRGRKERLNFVNTGVPHAVKMVDFVSRCDVDGLGAAIRRHPYFAPHGANVDFVSLRKDGALDVRTYERGVEGETLACGTGSTAAALVFAAQKNLKSPVLVYTKSGETLKIYFSRAGIGFFGVYLEGRIIKTFEGSAAL